MKKHMLILFAALSVLSLLGGCGKKDTVMPTAQPTRPLATQPSVTEPATVPVRPSMEPEWDPNMDPSMDTTTESTRMPTIEDGNGPIPSQSEAAGRK